MTKKLLRQCASEGLIRLALHLHLNIEGMSRRQMINLIAWRLHPNRKRRWL